MKNKTCLITGANSGIGKETAKALLQQGAHLIMLCRNEQKAESAKKELINQTGNDRVEIVIADLEKQDDIRRAAETYRTNFDKLDVLVNNAGIIPSERRETADGIERTFAINHLGPFLLTNLLMEPLKKAESARVVNVSSEVHRLGAAVFDIENVQLKEGYQPMKAYGVSKLCNIMFTHELAKQTEATSITTNTLHPGVVGTRLADEAGWLTKLFYLIGNPFMRTPASGAQTSIYLATSDEVEHISGKYFKNKKVAAPSAIAFDDEITERLWFISKALTGLS